MPTAMQSRQLRSAKRSHQEAKKATNSNPMREESAAWKTMATKFLGHAALNDETIYALPARLIDAICNCAPKLFTKKDEKFERKLTQITGTGFFLKQPISYEPTEDWAPVPQSQTAAAIVARHQKHAQQIHELRLRDMCLHGSNELQIENILKRENDLRTEIDDRRLGYAGWLATDPVFRNELSKLRERWHEEVCAVGDFPQIKRVSWNRELFVETRFDREVLADFYPFYQRWGLEGLATWELPIPLRADTIDGTLYDFAEMGDSGVRFFIPYFLFRDQNLNLHELAAQEMRQSPPSHLDGWLNHRDQNWGHQRFGKMLWLYIFNELGIKKRYVDRVGRNTEKIDTAFQQYFSKSPSDRSDTVKRIRQKMNNLLEEFKPDSTQAK